MLRVVTQQLLSLENVTHCGASLSEQLKSVIGFLQLLKTVLFDFTNNVGILTLSGLGNSIEAYANCD